MSELESDLFWRPEALKVVRTQSPRMRQVLEKLKSVAPTRTTVLLLGDTGVGKGMIAKLIHQHSSRSDMPFVHLTAVRFRKPWWKANCSDTKKELSPERTNANSGALTKPRAVRFFWMKSTPFPLQPRSNCSRFCRSVFFNGSEESSRLKQMSCLLYTSDAADE